MTCRDIDILIDMSPDLEANPQVLEHLDHCSVCSALIGAFEEAGEHALLPPGTLRPIEAKIVSDLKPVRPLAPSRSFLIACVTIFLAIVCVGMWPFGTAGWSALSLAQRIGIFGALSAAALLLALSMISQMVPGNKYVLAPTFAPILILGALLIIFTIEFRRRAECAFVANGLVCLRNGLTCSVPAVVLFIAVIRRGAILAPAVIGATAGGLAGLTGLTVLEINCVNRNLFHILFWHGGVVLISYGAGAFLSCVLKQFERQRERSTSR